MGQRHPLRPVRARSRPCPLRTGPYVVFQQQSGRDPDKGIVRDLRSNVIFANPGEGTVKLTDLVPNQRLGKSLSC